MKAKKAFLNFLEFELLEAKEWEQTSQETGIQPDKSRRIQSNSPSSFSWPPNIVRNQKYTLLSFLPMILYAQARLLN